MYTWWPCTLVSYNNKAVCCRARVGWKREMTLKEKPEQGKMEEKKKQREYYVLFGNSPLRHLVTFSLLCFSKSVALYKSWCLFLRELLRVVTVLEVSSASSPSLASRTSSKKVKIEWKLFQDVSSCLSVPKWKRQTHTNIYMSRVTRYLLTGKLQDK